VEGTILGGILDAKKVEEEDGDEDED